MTAAKKTPTKASKPEANADLKPPSARVAQALKDARERHARRPIRPSVLQEVDGTTLRQGPPHSDVEGWSEMLTDTFGTTSREFAEETMLRLTNITKPLKADAPTQGQTNATLALMAAIDPANELEAAIGEQIIATHVASLDFLQRARLNAGQHVDAAAAYANMANKTSRTMATHVETLNKLRNGGKQTVEVRYVYVDARGGQNIIGDGAQGVFGKVQAHKGGGAREKPPQPHEHGALAYSPGAPVAPMWCEEPGGLPVHGSGDAGAEAVQASRGQEPRSADWQGQRPLRARPADERTAPGAGSDASHHGEPEG